MAIPPDPIEEALALATSVVIADVVSVEPRADSGAAVIDQDDDDDDTVLQAQRVVLHVIEVLKGSLIAGARVDVVKPAGEYLLAAPLRGPFLLDEREKPAVIRGRYGPDTYKLADIKRALARLR